MVGIAFTMRFIPSREDMDGLTPSKSRSVMTQPQAMEECPPGHVLMIDLRGELRARPRRATFISAGSRRADAAGIVTDGGFRDTNGVFKTGPARLPPPSVLAAEPHRASADPTCSCRSAAAASPSILATSWSATATP